MIARLVNTHGQGDKVDQQPCKMAPWKIKGDRLRNLELQEALSWELWGSVRSKRL
jgi:hypothetical protein